MKNKNGRARFSSFSKMNNAFLLRVICAGVLALGVTTSANATLISRLGGAAVYDSDLNITWLADANLAATNAFGVADIYADGSMTWNTAQSWLGAMNAYGSTGYLGFNDWRLPTADAGCFFGGCNGSEMWYLAHTEGVTAGNSIFPSSNPNQALFKNIQSTPPISPIFGQGLFVSYWYGTESSLGAFVFDFVNGAYGDQIKLGAAYAWAVRSGDVATVPIPAAFWLFGSGLIGLFGYMRRGHVQK